MISVTIDYYCSTVSSRESRTHVHESLTTTNESRVSLRKVALSVREGRRFIFYFYERRVLATHAHARVFRGCECPGDQAHAAQ